MDSCDIRTRAYKNGKTFEECKNLAESFSIKLQSQIEKQGKVTWKQLLELVDHDEIVYKLVLKYLRQAGYDIGDWKNPEIKKST